MGKIGNALDGGIERRQRLVVASVGSLAFLLQPSQVLFGDAARLHQLPTTPWSGLLAVAYMRRAMRPA